MPIYESYCRGCGHIQEWYSKRFSEITENPDCDKCGQTMIRIASSFSVVFTGAITTKYNDPTAENYHKEGHWAYRIRSSKSGNPEPVWIETFQQQKEFCKEEGLVNPKELPNMDAHPDGRITTTTGAGMPGCWT